MKKITSFLTLMLMLLVSNTVLADKWVVDDEADGLITDASQITSPYTESSEGSIEAMLDGNGSTYWHSAWSGGSVANGLHYFQVADVAVPEDGHFGFTYTRRPVAGDQITKWGVYGVPSTIENPTKAQCTLLATVETPIGSSNSETLLSQAIESQGFTTFRFYEEATGTFSSSGGSNRGYWHVAEFQILPCKQISDKESVIKTLSSVWTTYQTYLADLTPTGDTYGCYNAELVQAFSDALDAGNDMTDEEKVDNYSIEDIEAATQAIIDTYEAAVASRIPFAMAVTPGYYQIMSALDFTTSTSTTTVPTQCPDCEGTDLTLNEDGVTYTCGECGKDDIEGETETTTKHRQKAIYDNNGNAQWKEVEANAKFLWKVEATDKTNTYKVTNMHNGLTFDKISTSTAVTLSATDSLMVFDWSRNDAVVYTDSTDESATNVTAVNIRLAAQAERGYYYAHCGGHGGGAGVSGNIVGWNHDDNGNASDWYLVPVDEATALAWIDADSPLKVVQTMIDSINAIKATYADQKTVAEDKAVVIDTENPIITEGSQFSSPYTTLDEQDATEEQIFANLINEDGTTYWHSAWESGSVAQDVHYLQVKDVDLDGTYTVKYTRRPVSGDQLTKLRVKGYDADNESLTFDDGRDLGLLEFPCNAADETVISTPLFTATSADKVLRFYSEEEVAASSGGGSNRGYWHCKKFQIYPAVESTGATTTQAAARAEQITALDAAIAAWDAASYSITTVTDPTNEEFVAAYNAVIAANNAWQAVYADPAAMRTAVANAQTMASSVVEGENPGQWPAGSGASAINAAIETAEAYNNAGLYTTDGVAAQAEAVNAAVEAVKGAANQIEIGKWYTFRFATEDEYTEHKWDKSGAVSTTYGDLYGTYVAPANMVDADDSKAYEAPEELYKGQQLRFIDETEAEGNNAFRFVKFNDNGDMALQHQSGWYVGSNGQLGSTPALFSSEAIGYGKSLIKIRTINGEEIETGTKPSYMHAQVAGHTLVAWSATAIDSRSALYIENANADLTVDTKEQMAGSTIKFFTSPVDIAFSEDVQLYTYEGHKVTDGKTELAFNKAAKAEAGKAYYMTVDGDETETLEIEETLGDNFAATPDSTSALQGTYTYQWVNAEDTTHFVTIFQNVMQRANGEDNTDCARDISAYTGAIDLSLSTALESTEGYDLIITLDGDATAIKNVMAQLSNAEGKIYTIDGKYVGKGNLSSLRGLSRGIYVVNGVKVTVNK